MMQIVNKMIESFSTGVVSTFVEGMRLHVCERSEYDIPGKIIKVTLLWTCSVALR